MKTSFRFHPLIKGLALVSMAGVLAACNDGSSSDDGPTTAERLFEVSITNLTAGQPLSPMALIGHDSTYHAFMLGQPASVALEQLAEGGDNSALIGEAGASSHVSGTATGAAPLAPGGTETLMLSLTGANPDDLALSAVTMLVNTNDAITGVMGMDLSTLAIGETVSMNTNSYDTGTEANSEAAETIPGPAGGGEGFNAARDDLTDQVLMHSGAVTADGGLSGSALQEVHRWDNPVSRVRVTRIQ